MKFTVITEVPGGTDAHGATDPDADWSGNLAVCCPLFTKQGPGHEMHNFKPITGMQALAFYAPVFTQGEILVLIGDREPAGLGRKPSKWGVKYEEFDTIEEALQRAAEVSA